MAGDAGRLALTAVADRPTRGRWLRRSTLQLLVLLALSSVAGCLGHDSWWLDLCSHFRWQYLGVALLLGLLACMLKSWRTVLLALLVAAFNAVLIWPRLPAQDAPPTSGGRRISLIDANLLSSNRELGPFVDWVREVNPDIVVVQELTQLAQLQLGEAMPAQGLREVIAVPAEDSFGIGVWSRLPVRNAQLRELGPYLLASIHAQLETGDGTALDLFATHPFPPIGAAGTAARNAQLHELADWVGEQPRATLALVGDFNASPWSSALRELHATLQLSAGTHLDWPRPTWRPLRGGPLGWLLAVPIDHVLLRGATLRVHQIGPDIGSDHLPLRVVLEVPQ